MSFYVNCLINVLKLSLYFNQWLGVQVTSNQIISFIVLGFCVCYGPFAFSSQDEEVYFYEVKPADSPESEDLPIADSTAEATETHSSEENTEQPEQVTFHEERFSDSDRDLEEPVKLKGVNTGAESEEKSEGAVEERQEDADFQEVEREPVAGSKPILYLSFDDGPSKDDTTGEILDLLFEYGVPATFFITGERSRLFPDKIKQILDQGHYIGNHSYHHNDLTKMETRSEIRESLSRTSEAFLQRYGVVITCFRPPFGHVNKREREVVKELSLIHI